MDASTEPIAVVDDASFEQHRSTDDSHPECPERLVAAREGLHAATTTAQRKLIALSQSTVADLLEHRPELVSALYSTHTERYVRGLRHALARGAGIFDRDTFFCEGTELATFRAAAGCAELARALVTGEARRGIALVRPPGHHAERESAMGFCLLNNIAVAAHAALQAGARKVAIIDWDVHHGNGTEHAFESDPRVMFISLHQYPFYPGTGPARSIGTADGRGYTGNLALPGGQGDEAYAEAFRRVVLPVLDQFGPDLILVSAGYDAHQYDPLSYMELQSESFGAMTSALVAVSEKLGHGRVALVLEGGYDLHALRESMAMSARALGGKHYALSEDRVPASGLAAIEATARALSVRWNMTTEG